MTEEQTQEEIQQQEVETRAKSMGWIPKEEFKGDESNWRPANEFVERAETLLPIVKATSKKFEDKANALETTVSTLKEKGRSATT
jgi:hypothetical protein